MWNWLVSVLGVGASIVLYDGSPMLPTANILWDLVDRLGYVMFRQCETTDLVTNMYLDF